MTINDLTSLLKDARCSIDEIVGYLRRSHQDNEGVSRACQHSVEEAANQKGDMFMSTNGFVLSDQSYEHAQWLAEQDLAALARAASVTQEIRFTEYRVAVSPDKWSAAARLRLLNEVLSGMTTPSTPAPTPQPKPRNWA